MCNGHQEDSRLEDRLPLRPACVVLRRRRDTLDPLEELNRRCYRCLAERLTPEPIEMSDSSDASR
jgi:hypothetical protein